MGLGLALPHDLVYAQSTISFETVATATDDTGNATSLAISKPTGTAVDDLLIAVVSVDGSQTLTPPSGWTEIDQGQCASSACTLGVWHRTATASEPSSYTFTLSVAKKVVGAILRYSNAHVESNVIDVSGSATGTDTAPTAPSVTTTVANTLVLRVMSNDDVDLASSPYPGGTNGRFALETTGGGSEGGAGADAQQVSAGASGTAAFTLDATEEWRAVTVAIKPLQSTTIVADQAMTEENLDARTLALTLSSATFADTTLAAANFTLNNAPTGTTLESVTHDSTTQATIELAYDATDFDVNVTTFSVTIAAAELTDGGGVTSNTLTITASVETATISADQALAEDTLDARSLTLSLSGTTFANATLATGNFTLNNAPTGTTVESVTHVASTQATLALAFDGTDFDANVTTFSVTVAAVGMSDGVAITSNTLTIAALAETATIVADSAMTEENLDARSLTLTLGGGVAFDDATLATGNFTLNNAPTGTSVESVTHNSSTQATIALAFDKTDFDTDVTTFSVTVGAAELTVGSGVTSNTLTISALNEVATIVADLAMTEENLDARSLTLTLGGSVTFDDATLVAGNFTLNNLPTGASLESVTYDSATQATIALTVAAVELSVVSDATSNRLSVTATLETASITPDQTMTETNFNARTLTLTLSGATFADATLAVANFTLNTTPVGTSLQVVTFVSSTQATLLLAFNGTDFDSNVTFSVTVASAELTDGGAITSSGVTVTAVVEAAPKAAAAAPAPPPSPPRHRRHLSRRLAPPSIQLRAASSQLQTP